VRYQQGAAPPCVESPARLVVGIVVEVVDVTKFIITVKTNAEATQHGVV